MPIPRNPAHPLDRNVRQPFERLYEAVAGRLDSANVIPGGINLGTTLSQDAIAGNQDAVFATITLTSATAVSQTVDLVHNLGRSAIGFELVNANGAVQFYTNTATSIVFQETRADLVAHMFGSVGLTATLKVY